MTKLIWLGNGDDAGQLVRLLSTQGLELIVAPDLDVAVTMAKERNVAAVILAIDWGTLAATVSRLRAAVPELQVLMATHLGMPLHVSAALEAGVIDLLDLKGQDPTQTLVAIKRALARHDQVARERRLLVALRELNEEFLKAMVLLDRRNMELEHVIAASDGPGDGKTHVLVVDDESAIAQLFAMVLDDRGYAVETAADGPSAVSKAQTTHFQVVITDKNLPGMDGHQILREVKRLHADTDVIIVTGYGSKESVIEALRDGATDYIEKPVDDIEIIGQKVDTIVAAQRDRQKRREYLTLFKQRNREFLDQYKNIRGEIERWLNSR